MVTWNLQRQRRPRMSDGMPTHPNTVSGSESWIRPGGVRGRGPAGAALEPLHGASQLPSPRGSPRSGPHARVPKLLWPSDLFQYAASVASVDGISTVNLTPGGSFADEGVASTRVACHQLLDYFPHSRLPCLDAHAEPRPILVLATHAAVSNKTGRGTATLYTKSRGELLRVSIHGGGNCY